MTSDIVDADGTHWRFDEAFLTSNWTCIWGKGCPGILEEPAADAGQGCCSIGAELLDEDEAMLVSALAATIPPERFANHGEARTNGVFSDQQHQHTRVHGGACIFFNPPGFSGGTGCALHLEAIAGGESPLDWKPSVCWQLPLKVERSVEPDGTPVAELRRWLRRDWGSGGAEMAWCCTSSEPAELNVASAYVGDRPVIDALGEEIRALVGEKVHGELQARLGQSNS